jgi:probable blue pigment (indigoidine) exporter
VGGYLYLALANTAVAYWLWFRGIGRLTATQAGFLGPLSPLTAAAVGWAVLGQALTPVQLAGMAMAFGATLAGQLGEGRGRPGGRRSFTRAGRNAEAAAAPAAPPSTLTGR